MGRADSICPPLFDIKYFDIFMQIDIVKAKLPKVFFLSFLLWVSSNSYVENVI